MKHIKYIISLIICAAVCLSCFGAVASAESAALLTGTVNVGDYLNVRSGAGTENTAIDKLYNGDTVIITESALSSGGDTWYHITYSKDGAAKNGYVHSSYITVTGTVDPNNEYDAYLAAEGFPASYRTYLTQLHALHPNWIFKADIITPDWSAVLSAEKALGRNTVSYLRADSWKSVADGAYDASSGTWTGLDGASWVAASDEIVAYYLDPRNFLNDSGIFLFSDHSFDSSLTVDDVKKVVSGTFLDSAFPEDGFETYSDAIYYASQSAGVNPCVLASMIITEQGRNGQGGCISGSEAGYEGFYNYLNIGAYTTDTMTAVQRGLWWAQGGNGTSYGRPWNTRLKSLVGSAQFYANDYISVGQSTLYYKKFDVINDSSTGLYWHQYMSNIEGAESEASSLKKAYVQIIDSAIAFTIPVYSGIPDNACEKPVGSGTVAPRLLEKRISALPSVDSITLEYENEIKSIRSEYNTYSDAQKAYVKSESSLAEAERKIAQLKNPGGGIIGDVDGDGNITVSDVVALRKLIMQGYSDSDLARADVDNDGNLTVSDVVSLRSIIMNG